MAVPLDQTKDAAPDFRHVEAWIFDLDNTLYRADTDLFAQIDARMTAYVQGLFGLEEDAARRLQKQYYREFGTTLSGLMALHGVDPEHYLAQVHDIDLSALAPDESLKAGVARLSGRRFVFTNGCRSYARRILDRIGLSDMIDEVWDIRTIGFLPKPAAEAYDAIVSHGAFDARRAAMFEDIARNLVPAHGLGMTTVWLNNGSEWSKQGPEHPVATRDHIHYEIDDLATFLHMIRI
jgi:putative hydrolase of the HAD superfamily